ncbi:MAG: type III-B CRISPR module RAMP protein Cmr4 [Anaerolineae bacterium]|nr:type III-B CRISPR module RAMP protein Cmr4 [Anaerolineae bacterium]
MYEGKRMLFIYVETPLHAGTGSGLGGVDLPIQRERVTGYPMVQASSLKGRLRALVREHYADGSEDPDQHPVVLALFGRAGSAGENYAGALSPGDARLLLFPVRSLSGVFAWTTCADVLARFARQAELAGLGLPDSLPEEGPQADEVWVGGNALLAGKRVVLEDYSFTPRNRPEVAALGGWLAKTALPDEGYDYWKRELPRKLAILSDDAFRDFAQHATEVQTHIRLSPETKTVAGERGAGALWTVESLPPDTLLYAPILATASRQPESKLSAEEVLGKLEECELTHTQLGGDETTGQGWVALRLTVGGGR